jgi:DNA-damage-inducible protein J
MGRSVMLNVRMDDELKEQAIAVLGSLGLSASDAVRMLFTRVVRDRAFPLELKLPNDETLAAMAQADEIIRAGSATIRSADELFEALERERPR